MIYIIDPKDLNLGKPCKTLCVVDCDPRNFCAVKPLYGIDI